MTFVNMKVNRKIYFKTRDFIVLYNYLGQLKRLFEVDNSMNPDQKKILYPSEESPEIFIDILKKNREDQLKKTFLYRFKYTFRKCFLTELQLVECCNLLEDIITLSKKEMISDIEIKNLKDKLDQYYDDVFNHKFML